MPHGGKEGAVVLIGGQNPRCLAEYFGLAVARDFGEGAVHGGDGLRRVGEQDAFSRAFEHVDRLHRGLPLRGVRTELTIDPQGYIGEGDVFVFASVLNEFFALYASLNSYHELRVTSTQGDRYQWTPRMGLQPLL